MHASVAELLENVKSGVLWVTLAGVVRYANTDASTRTGLGIGSRLADPALRRAISIAITGRVPRVVSAIGAAGEGYRPPSRLMCRVIPGLVKDDAFVLLMPDPAQDVGAGFDHLMQAIRTDVREPLRQAQAAFALMESRGEASDEQSALHDGLQQLLGVVDRLVDLAELWDSEALLADDRIELWPLLQRIWGEVEPLALQRGVNVRFQPQRTELGGLATLYGSERWLGRVLQECLDAAVRSTPRHGVIDIEHRQVGPRALLVFGSPGVFATQAQPSDLAPKLDGASSLRQQAPIQDQMSFRLCERIVTLHGGQLREETADGARHFLIDLPTGAPYRDEQPELAMAQAQQYAQDLATLMKRTGLAGPSQAGSSS